MPVHHIWKLKMDSKLTLPVLHCSLRIRWPPSRVIYADNLFDAAQHRRDTDFILWTTVECLLSVSYWEINILNFIYSFIHYKQAILQTTPSIFPFPFPFFFSHSPRPTTVFLPNWMLFFIFILSPPNVQIYLNHPQTESYKIWITFGAFFFFLLTCQLSQLWLTRFPFQ